MRDSLPTVVIRVEVEVKYVRRSGVLLDGDNGARGTTHAAAVWLSISGRDPGRVGRGRIRSGKVDTAVERVDRVNGDGAAGANANVVDLGDDIGEVSGDVGGEVGLAAVQIRPRRISDGVVG